MDFKNKQDEIVSKGKAERGEFSPTPGSVPTRLYNYWATNGINAEMNGRRKQENFCHFWRVVVIWAPFTWFVLNIFVPLFEAVFLNPVSRSIGRVIGRVFAAPFRAISSRWNRLDYDQKHTVKKQAEKFLQVLAVTLFALVMGAYLLAGLTANWIATLLFIGGIIVAFGILLGLSVLGGYIAERREKARDAARKEREQDVLEGKITFDEYYNGPAKPPSRVKKFFSGVKDLLILLVQVIRVKKWKICPLVEIPKN